MPGLLVSGMQEGQDLLHQRALTSLEQSQAQEAQMRVAQMQQNLQTNAAYLQQQGQTPQTSTPAGQAGQPPLVQQGQPSLGSQFMARAQFAMQNGNPVLAQSLAQTGSQIHQHEMLAAKEHVEAQIKGWELEHKQIESVGRLTNVFADTEMGWMGLQKAWMMEHPGQQFPLADMKYRPGMMQIIRDSSVDTTKQIELAAQKLVKDYTIKVDQARIQHMRNQDALIGNRIENVQEHTRQLRKAGGDTAALQDNKKQMQALKLQKEQLAVNTAEMKQYGIDPKGVEQWSGEAAAKDGKFYNIGGRWGQWDAKNKVMIPKSPRPTAPAPQSIPADAYEENN